VSKTIEDVQNAYAQALGPLIPAGYSAVVELLGQGGRKKRRDAAAHNWDPLTGSVSIKFARAESPVTPIAKAVDDVEPRREAPVNLLSQPLTEAIRALDKAERSVSFVSIKWFRDQFLPSSGASWAAVPYAGQEIVKEAIDRGLFLTSKVPNPKTPAYPTTAIRLNRQLAEVQKTLGSLPVPNARTFHPVEIAGEPLSATVIRERR
jgi:hypothetical protein